MPSKKKKYNSRFPPARIKKIMQTDEEIGKVAAAVPVLISKCLEMFLASLLTKAGDVTKSKRAKTMSRSHLKQCIMSETMFDFLKDQVINIPDVQNDDEPSGSLSYPAEKETSKKVVRKRSLAKVKKTPKKRAKLGHPSNNNDSGEETDSADDGSDNGGSGQEGSDAMHSSSFSSPGLISPSVQSKLESQSSTSTAQAQDMSETSVKAEKSSFHIPLDALLSDDKMITSVEINKPLQIVTDDVERHSSQDNDEKSSQSRNKTEEKLSPKYGFNKDNVPSKNSPQISSPLQNASSVRQGVIVANTMAFPASTTTSMSHTSTPHMQNSIPISLFLSKTGEKSSEDVNSQTHAISKDATLFSKINPSTKTSEQASTNHINKESVGNDFKSGGVSSANTNATQIEQKHRETSDPVKMDLEPSLPTAPQPGSMLSFLYSTVSMPISSINVPPTGLQAPTVPASPTVYSYSPLSQHNQVRQDVSRLAQPVYQKEFPKPPYKNYKNENPIVQNNLPPNSGHVPANLNYPHAPLGYHYPYVPYNANSTLNSSYSTQSHFLGYPQSILTPPSHPSNVNPHLSMVHASLSSIKPAPVVISDEDDYDT